MEPLLHDTLLDDPPGMVTMRTILSFDLHLDDKPGDIDTCIDTLQSEGWKASFFVPTSMLEIRPFRRPLRRLAASGYEIGTHSHQHSGEEKAALRGGEPGTLAFLERSSKTFADFFGERPRMFRSPCWSYMSSPALDELARLGYRVDSSATPQRPGILSSFPYDNRQVFFGRAPHFVRPHLLEIPTSTLLVPLGWPTFCTLRNTGSMLLLGALMLEARIRRSMVVVGQFHISDLVPGGEPLPRVERHWSDLLPRTGRGIAARRWLRLTDRARVAAVSVSVMSLMAGEKLTTFGSVLTEAAAVREGALEREAEAYGASISA